MHKMWEFTTLLGILLGVDIIFSIFLETNGL